MLTLESPEQIYDNIIEYYFHEYFENRGIELDGNAYKTVPMNVYQSAFRYIYKKVFKPDPNDEKRDKRKTSTIDYNNASELEEVINIYGDIVTAYDIKSTQFMFCDLTGIHRDTLHSWESGNTRAYKYKDLNGNEIKDICNYKLYHSDSEYVAEPSNLHSDYVKKIKSFSHITAYNGLNDFQVGQITHANNSKEAGMEYNRKREAETVQARLLMASELPKLGNIAQQNNGLLEVIN